MTDLDLLGALAETLRSAGCLPGYEEPYTIERQAFCFGFRAGFAGEGRERRRGYGGRGANDYRRGYEAGGRVRAVWTGCLTVCEQAQGEGAGEEKGGAR